MLMFKAQSATAWASLLMLASGHSFAGYNVSSHSVQNSTGAMALPARTVTLTVTTTVNQTTTISACPGPSSAQPSPEPCAEFHVGIWSKYKAHHKHPTAYLGFSGNDALLVERAEAAVFTIEEGELKSEDCYIGSTKSRGAGVLQKKHTRDHHPSHQWRRFESGALELLDEKFSVSNGHAVLCATQDGSVFGQYTKHAGKNCKEIFIRAIDDVCPSASSTTTYPIATGRPGSSVVGSTSQSGEYPTSAASPNSVSLGTSGSSTPPTSSQGVSTGPVYPTSPTSGSQPYTTLSTGSQPYTTSSTSGPPPYTTPSTFGSQLYSTWATAPAPTYTIKSSSPSTTPRLPPCSDDADAAGGMCSTEESSYPVETPPPEAKFVRANKHQAGPKARRGGLLLAPR